MAKLISTGNVDKIKTGALYALGAALFSLASAWIVAQYRSRMSA